MPTLQEVKQTLFPLVHPWILMSQSLSFLPTTVFRLLRAGDLRTLTSWPRFRAAWFGIFWAWIASRPTSVSVTFVAPLLQGRVRDGVIQREDSEDADTSPAVEGTVLEVGPGNGMWVSVFTDKMLGAAGGRRIRHVFGVEPNVGVHRELRARVAAAGLEGMYEVVPVGIEDLGSSGYVGKGSVDCVVCIRCLCGIPEPERNIRELYQYLKPGGRMYIFEHVTASSHWTVILYQGICSRYHERFSRSPLIQQELFELRPRIMWC